MHRRVLLLWPLVLVLLLWWRRHNRCGGVHDGQLHSTRADGVALDARHRHITQLRATNRCTAL